MAAASSLVSDRIWLRVEDAALMIEIPRSKLYQMMRSGEMPSVKVGKSRRISVEALRQWAARIEAEQNPSDAA